jgi:hypothetical protein
MYEVIRLTTGGGAIIGFCVVFVLFMREGRNAARPAAR